MAIIVIKYTAPINITKFKYLLFVNNRGINFAYIMTDDNIVISIIINFRINLENDFMFTSTVYRAVKA